MRLQDRPHVPRAAPRVRFARFADARGARARDSRSRGSIRANCRLLDHREALSQRQPATGRADPRARLRVGRPRRSSPGSRARSRSARRRRDRAGRAARHEHGSRRRPRGRGGRWRDAFLARRRTCATRCVRLGLITETFETAVTWDRFAAFHAASWRRRASGAPRESAAAARSSCRFTYVYPDGPAPYYTVSRPGRAGGGARAVGRDQGGRLGGDRRARRHDHAPPRRRPRPPPVVRARGPGALRRRARAAKRELDPAGILNPGVLLPPGAATPDANGGTS